jgi:hypothetical protein
LCELRREQVVLFASRILLDLAIIVFLLRQALAVFLYLILRNQGETRDPTKKHEKVFEVSFWDGLFQFYGHPKWRFHYATTLGKRTQRVYTAFGYIFLASTAAGFTVFAAAKIMGAG